MCYRRHRHNNVQVGTYTDTTYNDDDDRLRGGATAQALLGPIPNRPALPPIIRGVLNDIQQTDAAYLGGARMRSTARSLLRRSWFHLRRQTVF